MKKFMALLGVFVLCFLFSGCSGDKGKSTPADPTGPGGGDTFPTMSAALDGSNIHVVLENMADDAGMWLGWIGSPLPPPPNGSDAIIWEAIPGDFITGNFIVVLADGSRHYMHLDVWGDGGFNGWGIAQTQYGAALHFSCADGAPTPTSVSVEVRGTNAEGEMYFRFYHASIRVKSDSRSYRMRAL